MSEAAASKAHLKLAELLARLFEYRRSSLPGTDIARMDGDAAFLLKCLESIRSSGNG